MFGGITILLWKEFTLELRRKSVISGIGVYLLSLVFICYFSFSLQNRVLNEATWSALYWLVILFSVVNSVAKSFVGEKKGLSLYYYSVASPGQIILSKIIYNGVLCLALSLSGFVLFTLVVSRQVEGTTAFFAAMILSSMGFSAALTLISAIASKTNHSNILMAVLSFPVVIGILLMAIRVTKNSLDGLALSSSYDELLNLLAINCILTALAYVLFPYIWRS